MTQEELAFLIDAPGAARLLGISERQLHSLRASSEFPKPVAIGARGIRWRTAELREWAETTKPCDVRPEPAHLRRARDARAYAEKRLGLAFVADVRRAAGDQAEIDSVLFKYAGKRVRLPKCAGPSSDVN